MRLIGSLPREPRSTQVTTVPSALGSSRIAPFDSASPPSSSSNQTPFCGSDAVISQRIRCWPSSLVAIAPTPESAPSKVYVYSTPWSASQSGQRFRSLIHGWISSGAASISRETSTSQPSGETK